MTEYYNIEVYGHAYATETCEREKWEAMTDAERLAFAEGVFDRYAQRTEFDSYIADGPIEDDA